MISQPLWQTMQVGFLRCYLILVGRDSYPPIQTFHLMILISLIIQQHTTRFCRASY